METVDNTSSATYDNKILHRLKKYLTAENINFAQFVETNEISDNNIEDKRTIDRICNLCPNLNRKWLCVGDGDMTIEPTNKGVYFHRTLSVAREIREHAIQLGIAKNQKDLAQKLGIQEQLFSVMITKRGFNTTAILKLKELIPDLNADFLFTGKGSLWLDDTNKAADDTLLHDYSNDTYKEQLAHANELNAGLVLQNNVLLDELQKQGARIDALIEILKK